MNESATRRQPRVLVVGGSHGISYEIVRALLDDGAHVTAVSRTACPLVGSEMPSGSQLDHITADVTTQTLSPEQMPDVLDGFVYSPGSINFTSVRGVKPEVMRSDFELNVVAATTSFQSALPALKASGNASAVFFSTVAVGLGVAMHSYIAASKGALQALTRTWAAELAPKIRVNCIAPALTDTPLAKGLLSSQQKRDAMAEQYPMGRIGQPEDIAAMAVFLLSTKSSWITGQVLGVDGGMSSIIRR